MPRKTKQQSRRDFLMQGLAAVPALALSGLALNASAASTARQAPPGAVIAPAAPPPQAGARQVGGLLVRAYQPSFFTQEEFAFLQAAVSRLIPKDSLGPGALEAGAAEFIDNQMQTPYGVGANWYMQGPFHPDADPLFGYQLPLTPREVYRLGIAEANAFAEKSQGKPFAELPPERQDALLALMESGEAQFSKLPSKTFFAFLLQNTREGFFSDPVHGGNRGLAGWKLIAFPGARADYMDWVERGEKYPFPPVSISGERG